MSKVSTLLKVMPVNDAVDLDNIVENIREAVDVEDTDREDIAFGLEALKILVKVDDNSGGTEGVVNTIENIENVKTVSVESVTRE